MVPRLAPVVTVIGYRPATPGDAPTLVQSLVHGFETYRAWAPPGWEPPTSTDALDRTAAALATPEAWALVAEEDGEPAGHVLITSSAAQPVLSAPPDHMLLWQLFVREPWLGRGVATELTARAVGETRARGFAHMALWTPRDHARARRFYEREGWRASGSERAESPLGLPVVEYVREV